MSDHPGRRAHGAGDETPSDWVSGERVFAPPRGTVDVDWLVPAVLELAPSATPAEARRALEQAWRARRPGSGQTQPDQPGRPDQPDQPDQSDRPDLPTGPQGAGQLASATGGDPLHEAADRVLDEALETFGG